MNIAEGLLLWSISFGTTSLRGEWNPADSFDPGEQIDLLRGQLSRLGCSEIAEQRSWCFIESRISGWGQMLSRATRLRQLQGSDWVLSNTLRSPGAIIEEAFQKEELPARRVCMLCEAPLALMAGVAASSR